MGFFEKLFGVPPAAPGHLVDLARKTNCLMADIGKPGLNKHEVIGSVLRHRAALAHSVPASDLDCLMLIMNARQAARILQTVDIEVLDESRLLYWTQELIDSLGGVQSLLEVRIGGTLEEMGFDIERGSSMN